MDAGIEKATHSYVLVRRQYSRAGVQIGEIEESEEEIAVHRFVTEPAHVGVEMGLTLNLGNYESAKLTVSFSVPCYKEEMTDAYAFARGTCEKILSIEKARVRGKGIPKDEEEDPNPF